MPWPVIQLLDTDVEFAAWFLALVIVLSLQIFIIGGISHFLLIGKTTGANSDFSHSDKSSRNVNQDLNSGDCQAENRNGNRDENRDENEHGLRYNSGQFDRLRNRLKSSKIVENDVKCSNRINGLFEAHLGAWNLCFELKLVH